MLIQPIRTPAMLKRLRDWRKDRNAVTAIEYAIIAGLVGSAILIAVQTLGSNVSLVFLSVARQLDDTPKAGPPSPTPNAMSGGGS